jgi:MFS family permease
MITKLYLFFSGILSKIQNDYKIGDAEGGALQTAFVVSYMIFAPIFGYLGDRQSRKLIMAFGVFLWTVFTIIGSFMPDYHTFLLCRAMVGIGEASYSTIAPTIISDMFVKDTRSKMLAFFYFAIPLGSGLGYVVGSEMTSLAGGDWRWGLRVTPILGLIAVFLILFLMVDPPRGESEGHGELKATTYAQDIKCLAKNKSFIFSTISFTCVAFCTGALSWWGPKYIEAAVQSAPAGSTGVVTIDNVALIFGFVTMLSGIVGVPMGSILSTKLKQKYPRADPIICAFGLLSSAILLGLGMVAANWNIYVAFILLFVGEVTLNLNWSIVADILLYVVVPTRRSTAEAIQILISHAFGDAGSPYLIGLVSTT